MAETVLCETQADLLREVIGSLNTMIALGSHPELVEAHLVLSTFADVTLPERMEL